MNGYEKQDWNFFDTDETPAVDFASFYRRHYNESHVSELFDRLVDLLDKLIQSDQIDSRRVINALERLRSTVKRNNRKDFFSTYATVEFAKAVVRNVVKEYAQTTPIVGPAITAIIKTIDELGGEMETITNKVRQDILAESRVDGLALDAKPLSIDDDTADPVDKSK